MLLPREMYGNGGLTSLREARSILERHAPMGEFLAYINSDEAALLKSRGGSGEVANESGIKSYGFLKKVFKPVAKVLDKIVPNEIKPFLPYIAAAIPFVGPAMSATLAGLSATQLAAVSAGANAFSQLSQEGAAERGLNPISLGLSALSGYTAGAGLQAPGAATAGNVVGNVPDYYGLASQPVTSAGVGDLISSANIPTGFQGPLSTGDLGITAPTFGQQVSNLGGSTTEFLGKVSRPGMESIGKIANDPFTASGGDYLSAAKTLAPGQIAAGSEQAYNAALDAQKAYQNELLAMGNLAGANKQDQINYIRKAMVSAGFNEDEILSAISRSGFMYGGKVESGLMSLKMGGMPVEMDLRAKGGFVPIGRKERADDVPARLSKNEFVFTAKAVRNAGGGDIRKGAKRMYQIMNQLEARA